MWILPKQLHTSAFVPDTAALNLDSNESSQICAQSLFVRSKPSPARIWSQKWKRDSWTQHLFGRILRHSHGESFVERWTSSLEVIPANHSLPPESEQARMTQDISGLGSQTEFNFSNLDAACLKTSKDTSRWDSPQSSAIWKKWVTRCRGEYSQRVKLARLTNASGCSSWPTRQASEGEKITGLETQDSLTKRMRFGQADQANHSTNGSRQESWATPRAGKTTDEDLEAWKARQEAGNVATMPLTAQVKAWATPRAEHDSGRHRGQADTLHSQIKAWGTPTARDHKSGRGNEERDYKELTPMVERTQSGKLNPRWVETLMGLPIGWTMPSCTSPVTIAQTSFDCSAME